MSRISLWCCIIQAAAWAALITWALKSGLLNGGESNSALVIFPPGIAITMATMVLAIAGIGAGAHWAIWKGGNIFRAWMPVVINGVFLFFQAVYAFGIIAVRSWEGASRYGGRSPAIRIPIVNP